MIVDYSHNGFVKIALETFKQIQFPSVSLDPTTFALLAYVKMGALGHDGIL